MRKDKITHTPSKDGHWPDPRPRFAAADGTGPRYLAIRVIEAETLWEIWTIRSNAIPFPSSLSAVSARRIDMGTSSPRSQITVSDRLLLPLDEEVADGTY
ncbi:hypothetical protein PPNSA23_42300 [Phyllobacterium phragmitis]|uniref:Uncharacterized protein n=1 Tax=Phyllobacterium phragmitis TaxID=2670329 RepID=A0ABQ0H5W0_9HYPH